MGSEVGVVFYVAVVELFEFLLVEVPLPCCSRPKVVKDMRGMGILRHRAGVRSGMASVHEYFGEVVLFFNLQGYDVFACEDGFAGLYFDLFEVS